MIKDLFFEVYKYSGGTLTYLLLLFAYIVFGIVMYFVISGLFKYKSNPVGSIVRIFGAIFLGVLLCIPSISAGINSFGYMTQNAKLQELSIKITPIKWQKGVYYIQLGGFKKGKDIFEYYNKAYDLIGSYKYKCWYGLPLGHYYIAEDYDKVLEIAEFNNDYIIAANCYTLKEDYQKALASINNAIDKFPKSGILYAKRGFICNKLAQKELAAADLKMALQLGKNKNQMLQTYNDWKNYELKRLAEKRKEAGID